MEVEELIGQLGGRATSQQLAGRLSRRQLRSAVAQRRVVRLDRGRYGLPGTALGAAEQLRGVVALRSAALAYGWAVKHVPREPEVAVGTKRRIRPERRAGIRVLWVDLAEGEVRDGVTSPLRTVLDCARQLPFDQALAVADSALRSGRVTRADLDAVTVRGAGAARVRRVLEHADRRAANAFESVLRAMALDAGLDVVPQAPVRVLGHTVHPDLVDEARRAVIEGDSHTFHTEPIAFAQDCERYNALVLRGWRVFRFTWEQVMRQPAYVRSVLRAIAAGPPGEDKVALRRPRAA